MELQGKNAIISGCARGIGRRILERFAEHGANIWACTRKSDEAFNAELVALAERCGVTITPVAFDLRNQDEMKAAVTTILASKRRVDVLVNNAGVTYNALFQMTSQEKMREVFEVNYFSQMLFTQYVVKMMVRTKGGSIVNISSTAALDGNAGRSAYGASKAALLCSTKAMAEELAAFNIRANAIAPGITQTDMVGESMSDDAIQKTISQTALKRMGAPSEIAEAAVFLASDLSSYITGQVLRVDGGLKN